MEIIRRTIGWPAHGHILPAMNDSCKYVCKTDIVGLSIVIVRPAWTYFKLFYTLCLHSVLFILCPHKRIISIIYMNLVIAGHVLSKRTLPTYYYNIIYL